MSGRPAPRSPLICDSANASVLSLDDNTVRPNQGRKRRRCIGGWVGTDGYVNGITTDEIVTSNAPHRRFNM
jgi:hypothetical protein